MVIAHHLLRQIGEDSGFPRVRMEPEVEDVLREYKWPGNVRELSNILERVLSSIEDPVIRLCDLPFYVHRRSVSGREHRDSELKSVQAKAEKEAIVYALEAADYNKARAARMLGIHRTLLYKKMRRYRLALDRRT